PTILPTGDGTPAGDWPNALDFSWSGGHIGGTLGSIAGNTTGSDPTLYDTGKSTLTAVIVRAGQQTSDAALLQMGRDLVHYSLNAAQNDLSPLGKFEGEYLARLHAAVARLNSNIAGPPPVLTPRA